MQNLLRFKKQIAVGLSLVIVLTAFALYPVSRSFGDESGTKQETEIKANASETADLSSLFRYEQYIARYSNATRPDTSTVVEAESFAGTEGMTATILDSYENASSPVVRTEDSGSIYWDVDVAEEGLYHIGIRYFPVEGNSSPIEREVQIDGQAPFEEARRLVFSRVWRNELSKVEQDNNGNDLRPRQVEEPAWQETVLKDSEGYYRDSFSFYLTKGKHRIHFVSLREPMIIDSLKLFQESKVPTYEEVKQQYDANQWQETKDVLIKVQGEDAATKSNPSLYPLNDRSSPATEPYHVSKIRMNTIGGANWKIPGQWLNWKVDIPEDGLYHIGFRYKQNMARGINVTRKLFIDGKVPFEEAETIAFPYDGAWQVGLAGQKNDDTEPDLYYLTKGQHDIKLEVTMGELADIIRFVRSSIQQLNTLYLKIVMITGTAPDEFRDYQLEKRIPDLKQQLIQHSKDLNKAAEMMDALVGGKSENATILRTTAYQLDDLASNPDTFAERLSKFKDNVSSLGAWLLTVNQQPLELDYMFIKSPNVDTLDANVGFFSRLFHELASFWYSFSEEYNNIGNSDADGDKITVWIAGGRDQAQLLRSMIDSTFTPETGINVNLQLVNASVVLPATLAGKGPEVAITNGDVVNFAMRNALVDLSQMPNFDKVKQRFMDSAFASFKFKGGVYAIPETQTFPMMFYRKDIFNQLGLKVPETWEDLYHIIPELQKHKMEIGMAATPVFEMMLYQNGGQYYKDDGIATALDTKVGIESFRKWTELYTNYKLPLDYNFLNRFRTGEMPIGIDNYSLFNSLTIFAPEIRGQWGFAPVPGTRGPDGTIHREALSTASGTVMFKNAKNKEAAWKFIDWWTDTNAQLTFGREMEAILGESARYAAANVETLSRLPWAARDYAQLAEGLKWVVGTPDVPGGYSLSRHLQNAFYEVYTDGREAKETIENYVRTINEEITIKRKEFDLPTK